MSNPFPRKAKIIGGVITDITEFPFAIIIRNPDNRVRCGGAIISNKHILTAAHCVEDSSVRSKLKIVTGTTTLSGSHKSVKGNIVFNKYQNKIDLPSSNVDAGSNAIVVGWGQVNKNVTKDSEELNKAWMTVLDNKECAMTHPFHIADEQLCAYQKVNVGLCTGDSGGPLVSNGKLIGIASFGLPCATGISDIYTRVFSFKDYIIGVMAIEA
ncbi:PREDICTED: chymotrypsin-1-like [Ceratosolen solmsi marchali]|uniref:Chymotrypsin-1-like n=1 Tax=Ceratosolen solmsi marchali TaxID=326594 RepID=A0AAJ6VLS6_9HYME|nr:PREDICTED: chymotrypsin-1-like [Ceratosolen solmsi marchali]